MPDSSPSRGIRRLAGVLLCAWSATSLSPVGREVRAEEFQLPAKPEAEVSAGVTNDAGFVVHTVRSAFQAGETRIEVLLPKPFDPAKKYPVVYVLPVEPQGGERYGHGLREVQRTGLADKFRLICVAPTFSRVPWYADHPTDPAVRQESYLLRSVVPFVEQTYPTQGTAAGRWLLGFSKSGWGAWTLLLRYPHVFGQAAAWDAPLALAQPDRYGTAEIFATQENFDRYQPLKLLPSRAKELGGAPRLILLGYDNFRGEHQQAHAVLQTLAIPHVYRDGPKRPHVWGSGWVEEALTLLTQPMP